MFTLSRKSNLARN
jgi:hypothetical protein